MGQTLLEAAKINKVDIASACSVVEPLDERRTEKWVETTYGEGPSCFWCHVQIPSSYNHLLPEQSLDEKQGLSFVWEDEYGTDSRLACMITLEKKHDGMVVFVPDAPPTDLM